MQRLAYKGSLASMAASTLPWSKLRYGPLLNAIAFGVLYGTTWLNGTLLKMGDGANAVCPSMPSSNFKASIATHSVSLRTVSPWALQYETPLVLDKSKGSYTLSA